MKKITIFLYFLLGFSFQFIHAQGYEQYGSLTAFNITNNLKNDWRINLKIEARQLFKEGFTNEKNSFDYAYNRTDVTFLPSKKVSIHNTVAFGYFVSFRENNVVHRLVQQFISTKKYHSFSLSHRFMTDETFEENQAILYRLRYRLASQIPLEGSNVDSKEFYAKINQEVLNLFKASEYDLELRLLPSLGYVISPKNKFEIGADYRISSFIDDYPFHKLFLTFNWFIII